MDQNEERIAEWRETILNAINNSKTLKRLHWEKLFWTKLRTTSIGAYYPFYWERDLERHLIERVRNAPLEQVASDLLNQEVFKLSMFGYIGYVSIEPDKHYFLSKGTEDEFDVCFTDQDFSYEFCYGVSDFTTIHVRDENGNKYLSDFYPGPLFLYNRVIFDENVERHVLGKQALELGFTHAILSGV
jgi:hypothetical protein